MNEKTDDLWVKWCKPQQARKRPAVHQTQLTLDSLRDLVNYGGKPSDGLSPSRASSTGNPEPIAKPVETALQKPAVEFRLASGKPCTGGSSQDPTNPHKRGHRLHPKLEGGGEEGGSSADKDSGNEEFGELRSLLGGEINEDHLRLVLSMKQLGLEPVYENTIQGLQSVKQIIKSKVIQPMLRPDLHQGLFKAARGILFYGPPGTGKTTLAKWIATECHADFFCVSTSSLISKYHGETETTVKTLFLVCQKLAPSIVFIDEIDSILGKRTDKEEDATVRMKNQVLQMMDGFTTNSESSVLVLGATNRPDSLDEAVLRRFSKRIYVPLPDIESRKAQLSSILYNHAKSLNQKPLLSVDDLHQIAIQLQGFNGSDIHALCTKAAEFVYQETLDRFNGDVLAVPGLHAFRPMEVADLLRATGFIKKSSFESTTYKDWEAQYGAA
eukprot:Protomagalhaensia_sp_Gyna_25__99@NODE_104_length_5238_cov_68_434891_g81_i0_p2_GENE_NODE_104_length_5238_cov_68_434891_g81_i0NODE_104_length_5238_cov_68_434891_g81_i0_p2_ORF_typecomplete_len441_score62_21AAA/PF00004_29/1_1e40RuvB_N/PF05496_12/3_9e12RuvB_N/PF05496_12/95AAA_5/PF07728_14/1_7e09AAA_22/PF13401_6/4_7e07AAA_2/PF07724_14/2_3e07TniB/PF05621_11/0_0036TniB/PF05621_11/0_33AAA_16/PF13191_6/2_4e06IstB_IS21/PF01695_17/3_2e06AAA_25/PF13481_6/0_011AAA_25/PF13481_6/0_3AAA_14/PF13173_6/0_00012AAA_1